MNSTNDSSEFQILSEHYDNLSIEEGKFINTASIPSKIIETKYLPVFLIYNEEIEDFIFDKNNILKPEEDKRGFQSSLTIEFKRGLNDAAGIKDSLNLKEYLKTVNEIYTIKIDSNQYQSDFIISSNTKERLGFETYLNIKKLDEGKHILTITGPIKENPMIPKSKTVEKILATIPFWYFPENRIPSINQHNGELQDTLTTN
ncbi:hypothetical protein [Maribacter aquivivus]|uniref:hypothetical protein n=1 Tax=Maribacter aquivivus TaxID=228958 RepID=UPI002491E372|nr:hypothetical protein [Maribacter aquivivus]